MLRILEEKARLAAIIAEKEFLPQILENTARQKRMQEELQLELEKERRYLELELEMRKSRARLKA